MVGKTPGNMAEEGTTRYGDWKWALALSLLCYMACLGIRLLEYPGWDHPGLWVNGDPILGTHDSYYWLAAASGLYDASYSFLEVFTSWMSSLTGMTLPQVAFWFPAILGSLTAVAAFFWGRRLGGLWAGLAAGVLGGLAPGFISRSRLGYYDSDVFTMLMPLVVGLILSYVVAPYIRSSWLALVRGETAEPGQRKAPGFGIKSILLVVGLGLVTRVAGIWHMDLVNMHLLLWYGAVALLLVLARPGLRGQGLLILCLFGAVAFFATGQMFAGAQFAKINALLAGALPRAVYVALVLVLLVAVIAGVGLVLERSRRDGPGGKALGLAGPLVLLALLIWSTGLISPFGDALSKIWLYLTPGGPEAAPAMAGAGKAAGPVYPSIVQSIIEAKLAGWGKVLTRIGPLPWVSVLGVLGYLWVLWKRPLAVFLAPMLVLALGGHWMGVRFTMFGGPVVAVGLGAGLALLVQQYGRVLTRSAWLEPVVLVLVAGILVVPLGVRCSDLQPTPVLAKPHVEALMALKDKLPEDAEIWTWWDWGYATQYYTGHMTPIDGGKHAGRDIYPTALALTTGSLGQANRMIRYGAAQDYEPARVWDTMSGVQAALQVEGLKTDTLETPDIPPQYLVVGWANFPILEWISYYGAWDLASGEGVKGQTKRIKGFRFDPKRGAVVFEDGRVAIVSSVDSLEPDKTNHLDLWMNTGPHLVVNKYRGDAYLMDDTAYYSVMVQLLLADPDSVSEYFELVYNGMPHIKVYRVVGS